jgi:hypothetical protein
MKSKIKWNLTKVSPKEIAEINDFVESILRKKKENRKIVPLKGVWKGLGFEKNPNLEEEIKDIPEELAEQLLRRSEFNYVY